MHVSIYIHVYIYIYTFACTYITYTNIFSILCIISFTDCDRRVYAYDKNRGKQHIDMLGGCGRHDIQGKCVGLWEKGTGHIIGVATISDCLPFDKSTHGQTFEKHRVPASEQLGQINWKPPLWSLCKDTKDRKMSGGAMLSEPKVIVNKAIFTDYRHLRPLELMGY